MTDESLSFATDIRPMFTELDVDHMQPFGIDLSDAADVKSNAEAIYSTVSEGRMPPPGTGERWSAEMCERFKRWVEQGCPP